MLPQWDQVAESISRLMASNRSVRYGMLAFPNEVVDDNIAVSGNDWPYVTIATTAAMILRHGSMIPIPTARHRLPQVYSGWLKTPVLCGTAKRLVT